MPLDGRDRLAELGDLLAALRLNGVPVGPGEIARLRHLFACQPRIDRCGLQALLAALLVKTPAQRQTFEALFAAWCPDHDADWPEAAIAEQAPAPARPPAGEGQYPGFELPPPPPPPDLIKRLLAALAGLLLLAALVWSLWPPPDVPPSKPSPPSPPVIVVPKPNQKDPDLPDQPVNAVWSWRIDDVPPASIRVPQRLGPLPLALLGAIALVLALALLWRYRQRFPIIAAREHAYRGFGWQALPPPARDDGALIDARARRQLVWNIERFVADDPTRRLNLPSTVEHTARAGGFMRFSFHSAVYERAIWFWLDRHLERPTAKEIAAQLGATLRAAGLDARQGFFTDTPQRVDWPGQPAYRPEAEEGQGRQAQVAIFSDGAGLRRRLEHPLHKDETQRLLGALKHWPRLCFVDCSPGGEQLAALFAKHRLPLEVIALPQLPDWLGAVASQIPAAVAADDRWSGPARRWAAVVALGALGAGHADAAAAHSLRVVLGLPVEPWEIDRILDASADPEGRRRLINWLLRSEPLAGDALREDSLARRALAWWHERYVIADREKRAQENPLLPWRDSLAERRWRVEGSLLQLYTDPAKAADRLSEAVDAETRPEIEQRLSEFVAADHRGADRDDDGARIHLSWRFAALPETTRHRLRQLGFAADESGPPPARLAPRLVFATTLLGTLALAAFAVAALRWFAGNEPRLLVRDEIQNHPTLAAQTLRVFDPTPANGYRVTLGSPRESVTLEQIAAGAEIDANWRWEESANPLQLDGGVLLRAGSLAQPIRACAAGWPQRSLAVVAAPYADTAARQLAIRLLDKGSADQVLVGVDWQKHLHEWLGPNRKLNRNTQILVIVPPGHDPDAATRLLQDHPGASAIVSAGDLAALARAVDFPGAKPIDKAGLPWHVIKTSGEARIYGGPETSKPNGRWVSICPGSFTMGSSKDDAMAKTNEIVEPTRVVTLSPFDIAASETTNEQYAQVFPEHQERNDRPVTTVNWEQARSFCQSVGGDLPSEAQWEYAARGGSRTRWSFGDDESQLGRHAWFDKNSNREAQAVKQKRANPQGLYDMHGNVWEWTRELYGNYQAGSFVDPEGAKGSGWRVLRGGSFDLPPATLRSAFRVAGDPEFSLTLFGFRCVRVPPQPLDR